MAIYQVDQRLAQIYTTRSFSWMSSSRINVHWSNDFVTHLYYSAGPPQYFFLALEPTLDAPRIILTSVKSSKNDSFDAYSFCYNVTLVQARTLLHHSDQRQQLSICHQLPEKQECRNIISCLTRETHLLVLCVERNSRLLRQIIQRTGKFFSCFAKIKRSSTVWWSKALLLLWACSPEELF